MIDCASPGSFTDYAEESILNHICNIASWAPPPQLYVGCGSSTNFELGLFTELSGKGYSRRKVYFTEPTTDSQGITSIANRNRVEIGPALQQWDQFTNIAFFDAATGGNMITWTHLQTWNYPVQEDQSILLECGQIELRLGPLNTTNARWSEYLQERVMRHVFLNESYSPPTWYCAVPPAQGAAPTFDDTGSTITEPSDPAYVRQVITWLSAVQEGTNGASCWVNGRVTYPTAQQSWYGGGDVGYVAYCDAVTGGNLLAFGPPSIIDKIKGGEVAQIAATLVVGLQ